MQVAFTKVGDSELKVQLSLAMISSGPERCPL